VRSFKSSSSSPRLAAKRVRIIKKVRVTGGAGNLSTSTGLGAGTSGTSDLVTTFLNGGTAESAGGNGQEKPPSRLLKLSAANGTNSLGKWRPAEGFSNRLMKAAQQPPSTRPSSFLRSTCGPTPRPNLQPSSGTIRSSTISSAFWEKRNASKR